MFYKSHFLNIFNKSFFTKKIEFMCNKVYIMRVVNMNVYDTQNSHVVQEK